jgi:aminoglycoside phosphotransferase (APT) family kinase protein
LDGRTLAVFEFVDGKRGAVIDQRLGPSSFNYDYEAFVALLASVHKATGGLGVELPLETFSIPWGRQFEVAFARAMDSRPQTPIQARLRVLLQHHQSQIEADWADLQSMVRACRHGAWTPVLTHGDLAGDNIIIGVDGALHPIDWDDPVLAPTERDAWFFTCDPEAEGGGGWIVAREPLSERLAVAEVFQQAEAELRIHGVAVRPHPDRPQHSRARPLVAKAPERTFERWVTDNVWVGLVADARF